MLGSARPRGLGEGSPHIPMAQGYPWEVGVGNFTGREGTSPGPDRELVTAVSTWDASPLGDPGRLWRTAHRSVPEEEAGDLHTSSSSSLATAAPGSWVSLGLSSCSSE